MIEGKLLTQADLDAQAKLDNREPVLLSHDYHYVQLWHDKNKFDALVTIDKSLSTEQAIAELLNNIALFSKRVENTQT